MNEKEIVLILDGGSRHNQRLTRKIREFGIYSELHPTNTTSEQIKQMNPKAIILSGDYHRSSTAFDKDIFSLNIQVLALNSSVDSLLEVSQGSIKRFEDAKVGEIDLVSHQNFAGLLEDLETMEVWGSRNIEHVQLPEEYVVDATSKGGLPLAFHHQNQPLYGWLFSPDTEETPIGEKLLREFLFQVARCSGNWTMKQFIEIEVERIRQRVGDRKVLCALSGGVDSSVVAALMHEAIGDQLTCIFVDHGLLRKNEADDVMKLFADDFQIHVIKVDAKDRFLNKLRDVTDPEEKRKIIGNEFIYVFDDAAAQLKDIDFLAQGTLYTDILESGSDTSATIKSHHNVGGLPEDMAFELIEPLSTLFKDEIRSLGSALDIPDSIVWR